MKKGILVVIGIAIVIAIAVLITGLNVNTGKETKTSQNPIVNSTTLPSPATPVTHGRNLSVNLTESVGVNAH